MIKEKIKNLKVGSSLGHKFGSKLGMSNKGVDLQNEEIYTVLCENVAERVYQNQK